MRRFAIFVAVFGVCCSGWATAAPFDQLSSRLQQYDDDAAPEPQPERRRTRPPARQAYLPPQRGTMDRRERAVSYDETTPSERGTRERMPVDGRRERVVNQEELAPDDAGPGNWQDDGGFGGCDDCCDFCPSPCCGFWARSEYIYWWVRGGNTPALLTTSPDHTPQRTAGVLPDATVLFGDQRLNQPGRSGGRFTVGYTWDSCCARMGLEGSFLFLGNVSQNFQRSSGGSPILARPFTNVLTGQQDSDLLAFPNVVVGSFNAASTSRVIGFEINLRRSLYGNCCNRLDVLAGYRFLQFSEGLQIDTHSTSVAQDSPIEVGTNFAIQDVFNTRNTFNGGQLGLDWQHTNGCWTLDLLAKLALGAVSQNVSINGRTVVTVPGGSPSNGQGGVLALPSNIGSYNHSQFGVLPEFGANLRYQITPSWKVSFGYTLLVLTNVVRPGDQIDLRVDPNQFPPPVQTGSFPKFAFHDSDVWLQGVNVGLECNF